MEHLKTFCDAISICGVIGTLAGMLPHIAALASLVWTLLRIYETRTVQIYLSKRRKKKGG